MGETSRKALQWGRRSHFKRLAQNADNYFNLLIMDNAMPVIKGAQPIPLSDAEVRQRVRRAIHAIILEGELVGKRYEDVERYLDGEIARLNEAAHYNPYRDTTLAFMAMLNCTNYLLALYEHDTKSRFLNRLLKHLRESCPMALMHVYGKQLSDDMRRCYPKVAKQCQEYVTSYIDN